ncbi:MAG: hypothetical protein ACFFAS_13365 [Promethearchaeota archaeon]
MNIQDPDHRINMKKNDIIKYDFGWSLAWMNGYWIFEIIILVIVIWLLIDLPLFQFIGLILIPISLNLFGGNIAVRRYKSLDYLTLPYTNLLFSKKDYVLDAGCGAGRTTIELNKLIGEGRISTLDKKIFYETGFKLSSEGIINGGAYFLLEKPN